MEIDYQVMINMGCFLYMCFCTAGDGWRQPTTGEGQAGSPA